MLRPDSERAGEEPLDGLRHHLMMCVIERVAQSGEPFVLRGGMLTRAWVAPLPRPARDLDFVGDFAFDIADTARRLRGALARPLDDGACIAVAALTARGIWEDTAFPGVHVDVPIGVGDADTTLGIDVGFRDPLVPAAAIGLFGARVVRAETQLAWKLHALAEFGDAWRPKDVADLWLIATRVPLDDAELAPAIEAAFASRGYPLAGARAALDDARWTTKAARVRWNGARGLAIGDAIAAVRARLAAALAALEARVNDRDIELLAAVLAQPDDDAPRLVYADWLEERGEVARAQVIHLQCELARIDRRDRRALEIGHELDHVLAELDGRWRAELPELHGVEWLALERGFAASVRVADVATLVRHGDAIATAAPVTRVELDMLEPMAAYDADDLAVMLPWLRALATIATTEMHPLLELPDALELDGDLEWLDRARPLARLVVRDSYGIGRAFAERAARAPWTRELVALRLGTHSFDANQGYGEDPRLGADGARALAKLVRLETLDVRHQRIGSAALGDLAAKLPALRELAARDCAAADLDRFAKAAGASLVALDLSENGLDLAGMKALARAPRAAELRELALDTCELTSTALAALVHAPCWQTLRALDVSRNPLGGFGARTLADAPRPRELHTLAIADADLDDDAGGVLAKAAWLDQLAVFDASGNALGEGTAALVRALSPDVLRVLTVAGTNLRRADAGALARLWPQLVALDAGKNAFGDAGLERFAGSREAHALQRLALAECALRDDALELLGEHARAPRLRTLTLSRNDFSPGALARFLASPLARQLVELELQSCAFVEAGARVIAAAAALPRLRVLDLRGNAFGEAGLVSLADAEWLRGVPTLRLSGTPWQFARTARERLAERFGTTWYQ